ncbi:hydroxymethylglutaryl-CoA lyase [Aureispira anguillae]|uniref:Hydroxymethylglutaryl-CoA lyase n=1 Tax=Aureispira anguillae TaxID=2864201 RepID=A0A916DTZ9_9BACT|nr:hydroxymethylglutaryl-CoA lyase [Aureispira anguillae]BDS11861.1 hydroxymethylglutaryl-CoA lyase [Aureispira anguillae]
MVKVIECPRDAMQGIKEFFIETDVKANYINKLLQVGFDTIDFGSFVSPKAIPQMKDTAKVLSKLDLDSTATKLLAIVANRRGAEDACAFDEIAYLGYPFSISETFQLRNTNATITESLKRLSGIQELCQKNNKQLVVYVSMGFGNPYGDEWNVEIVQKWVNLLADMGIKILSLSDTIGVANRATIEYLFSNLIPPYPDVEFGAHFHTRPDEWEEKIDAAFRNGCRRFDGAIKGYGGCPMAKDDLTGNMPTEKMLNYFINKGVDLNFRMDLFAEAMGMTNSIFPVHT